WSGGTGRSAASVSPKARRKFCAGGLRRQFFKNTNWGLKRASSVLQHLFLNVYRFFDSGADPSLAHKKKTKSHLPRLPVSRFDFVDGSVLRQAFARFGDGRYQSRTPRRRSYPIRAAFCEWS